MDININLQEKVKAAIAIECPNADTSVLEWRLIYDEDRKIFRLDLPSESAFFILKVRDNNAVKEDDLESSSIQGEYDKLVNAWQNAKNLSNGLSMSKPISLWLEHNAILISGCDGNNLNEYFKRNLPKWLLLSRELEQRLEHVGLWLGNYHSLAGEEGDKKSLVDFRLTHVERMLKIILERANTGVNTAVASRLKAKIAMEMSAISSAKIGQIHGNFAYRNILCDHQHTSLVDFEDARIDLMYCDTGQFIAEIWFKSYMPWLRHQTNKFISKFLRGYSAHCEIETRLLDGMIAYHLLVHLYEHSNRGKVSGFSGILVRYRIRYLTKLLVNWLNNDNATLQCQ